MAVELKSILIVEDEAIMRESLRDWLKDSGYDVDTAEEGEQALEKISERDYGVIILDLRLPGKDGIDVLQQAKLKRPLIKGIIITAYPSVPTAVRTMKEGAIDYLPKPIDLDELEKLIDSTLKPGQPAEMVNGTTVEKTPKVEMPVVSLEQVPVHLKQGKAFFEAGRYEEALREFEAINKVSPGNIESWVWSHKTRDALIAGKMGNASEDLVEITRPTECLWMKLELVPYHVCNLDYQCSSCEFDTTMQEKLAAGGISELDRVLEKLRALPGSQRLCRYATKGDLSGLAGNGLFHCSQCEYTQIIQKGFRRELTNLALRREAIVKGDQTKNLRQRKVS